MSQSDGASTSNEIKPESDELFIPIPADLGPDTWPERCIYRVPRSLRSVNPSAYTPNLVSIGPLHHGDERLHAMETQKLRYLQHFCKRTEKSSSELAEPVKKEEANIRRCYAESSKLCSKNFIRMILLDSVFIIELFLRNYNKNKEDYILSNPLMESDIQRDLMILENQLPWFILEDLYNFASPLEKNHMSFFELTVSFIGWIWGTPDTSYQKQSKLFGDCWFSSLYGHWFKCTCLKFRKIGEDQLGAETKKKSPEENPGGFLQDRHFVDVARREMTSGPGSPERSKESITKLYNATKLHGAGVKFKLSSRENSRLGITFEAGVLSIPVLQVDDMSECIYRNVMAFEQCHPPYHRDFCDLILFLDYLIDSENDVDLLVQSGVIVNFLGESGAVSRMVNKLGKEITLRGWLYDNLSEKLNAHADNSWNRSLAILKSVYFDNPWRGTGAVAAFVMLVLTSIQTFWKH